MKSTIPIAHNQAQPASLIRRLAAISYDSLICIALMMVVTGAYMMLSSALIGAEHYRALNDAGTTTRDPVLTSVLFSVLFFFFGYFWTKNGQTLGMQVWHLRVQNHDGSNIRWTQALLRFLMAGVSAAVFGLGYFWVIVDKKGRSWQCLFSESEIVRLPKKP